MIFVGKFKSLISTVKQVFAGIEYCYEFVLTDEETRTKLIDFIKPSHFDVASYLNLNVAFGVVDSKRKIFLTLSRCEGLGLNSEGTGNIIRDTYVVITEDKIFKAVCTRAPESVKYDIPDGWKEIVIPAIEFFSDMTEWEAFEKRLAEKEDGFSLLKLRGKYNSELVGNLKKKFERENPNVTEDSLKKSCEINTEEEARKLFISEGCNPNAINKNYNEATIKNYKKYAGMERKWAKEEYIRMLDDIAEGNVDDFEEKLGRAKFILDYWISDDPCEELILKAWQTIFEKVKLVPRAFLHMTSCMNYYSDRFVERAEKIEPILDLTDNFLKEHLVQEYEDSRLIYDYKDISIRLRGIIAERRRIENPYGLEFVLTDDEVIEKILSMFSKVYDTPKEFCSEVVEQLNFTYGVMDRSRKIFLTGFSYGANTIRNYKSYDKIKFAIIIGEERNVLMLDCKRDTPDGSIRIVRPYETAMPIPDDFDKYREIITQMIAFYRNKFERDIFEKKMKEQNSNFDMNRLLYIIPKTISDKYPAYKKTNVFL